MVVSTQTLPSCWKKMLKRRVRTTAVHSFLKKSFKVLAQTLEALDSPSSKGLLRFDSGKISKSLSKPELLCLFFFRTPTCSYFSQIWITEAFTLPMILCHHCYRDTASTACLLLVTFIFLILHWALQNTSTAT